MVFVGESVLDVIGFRGVAIPPRAYNTIFQNGFQQKEMSREIAQYQGGFARAMYYNDPDFTSTIPEQTGDMYSDSAHCVSMLLEGAALFPNDTAIIDTWIFIVYVRNGFNTYEQQQMDCHQIFDLYEQQQIPIGQQIINRATWPLGVQECAAVDIPPRHILGCVRCTRTWATTDWHDGGLYQLHEPLYWNTCRIDPALTPQRVAAMEKRVLKKIAFHATGQLPVTPR